jgi:hypothetical protein
MHKAALGEERKSAMFFDRYLVVGAWVGSAAAAIWVPGQQM